MHKERGVKQVFFLMEQVQFCLSQTCLIIVQQRMHKCLKSEQVWRENVGQSFIIMRIEITTYLHVKIRTTSFGLYTSIHTAQFSPSGPVSF